MIYIYNFLLYPYSKTLVLKVKEANNKYSLKLTFHIKIIMNEVLRFRDFDC